MTKQEWLETIKRIDVGDTVTLKYHIPSKGSTGELIGEVYAISGTYIVISGQRRHYTMTISLGKNLALSISDKFGI